MAAGEPDPFGSFPAAPEIAVPAELPAIEAPPPPPELPPPPSLEPPATVTVTENGSGGLDVSVRVLSPEEAHADAASPADESVISDDAGSDITAPAVDPAPDAGSDAVPAEPAGTDVDVSVRVLSPGKDGTTPQPVAGPVSGEEIAAAGEPSRSAAPTAPVASETDDAGLSASGGEQYHGTNSQYQSATDPSSEAWYWSWYLRVDCDGNADSTTDESGTPSSREWAWDWRWEWDCGAPERPPPIDELAPEVDERTVSDDAAREGTQAVTTPAEPNETNGSTETTAEPWLWTWAFTFCGETAAAVLPIAVRTPLEWTWDWTWIWTCDGDGEAAGGTPTFPTVPSATPAPAPAAPSAGEPQSSFELAPAGTSNAEAGMTALPSLPAISLTVPVVSRATLFPPLFDLSLPDLSLAGPAVEVLVEAGAVPIFAPAALPLPPAALPAPPSITVAVTLVVPVPAVASPTAPHVARVGPAPPGRPARTAAPRARSRVLGSCCAAARPTVPAAPAEARPGPRRAPAPHAEEDGRGPLAPTAPLRSSRLGSASSSVVPGGLVAGTAALVALLLLSAPGLGRRIRVARALRPRGTIGSSIDRPG